MIDGNRVPEMPSSEQSWPTTGLEHLGKCPVCGDPHSQVLYEGLTDDVFKCAPGRWALQRCQSCRSAYLDPRPSRDTIGLAYQSYYTHAPAQARPPIEAKRGIRWILRALANGYRNWRYGTDSFPASQVGIPLLFVMRRGKHTIDREFRFLPRQRPGLCLLDVGFGNGRFMDDARLAGWITTGVDLDPVTVASARLRGHDARSGGVEIFDGEHEKFDVITMSHVIEHVHDPVSQIKSAYRLLRPGGQLWLDTPNIDSSGLREFGRNWRGLEPPRHLVIFGWEAMLGLLAQTGFVRIRKRIPHAVTMSIYRESAAIRASSGGGTKALRFKSLLSMLKSRLHWRSSEFITLTAMKPGSMK